jgi:hypothetical protein
MLQNMTIATYVILQNKVTIANTILTNIKEHFFSCKYSIVQHFSILVGLWIRIILMKLGTDIRDISKPL